MCKISNIEVGYHLSRQALKNININIRIYPLLSYSYLLCRDNAGHDALFARKKMITLQITFVGRGF